MTEFRGHFEEELQDFLDGRLTSDQIKEINSHLNQCSICRFQIDALKKAKQAATEANEIPVSPDLCDKIVDSLNQEDDQRKKN